jgi:MoxR-like ATPase
MSNVYGCDTGVIQKISREADKAVVGRRREIDVLTVGLLTGQNVAWVGPAGLAKTYLAQTLAEAYAGNDAVKLWQYHAQTAASEVMGDVDMGHLLAGNGVKHDHTNRYGDPRLRVAIEDEVFKASSQTLSCGMRAKNEGVVEGIDGEEMAVTIRSFIALSNEYPAGTCGQRARSGAIDNAALWDRYHLRMVSAPLSGSELLKAMKAVRNQRAARRAEGESTTRNTRPTLTRAPAGFLETAYEAVDQIVAEIPDSALKRLVLWNDAVNTRGIYVSNRGLLGAMQVTAAGRALSQGRDKVKGRDLQWAARVCAFHGADSLSILDNEEISNLLLPDIRQVVADAASEFQRACTSPPAGCSSDHDFVAFGTRIGVAAKTLKAWRAGASVDGAGPLTDEEREHIDKIAPDSLADAARQGWLAALSAAHGGNRATMKPVGEAVSKAIKAHK